jgi:hypothetical protein
MRNTLFMVFLLVLMVDLTKVQGKERSSQKLKNDLNQKQPWSEYTVHQMDRPHPSKVQSSGALCTKPPKGGLVLFDGTNTDAFTVGWKIKDSLMIASPRSTRTKKAFGSCTLHLEWRVPAGRKIDGQKGGNSGVFLMDRYEIQIMESHTNVTYADGQAAAIYGQTPPSVNASLPQGEWQSYDIIFEAPVYGKNGVEKPAYITVLHNGVKVHDRQEIYGPTKPKVAASYPVKHPKKAPIRFQWHQDPIEYRNIWVVENP